MPPTQTYKLISWNVAGLRAVIRKGALIDLLNREKPTIICLQEIKCMETDIPAEFIKECEGLGYKTRLINSAQRKGYSGTAIFVKSSQGGIAIDVPEKIMNDKIKAFSIAEDEGRLQIYNFGKFILMNMYVPNAKPDLSRLKERVAVWEAGLREIIADLEKRHSKIPIIITGDFNVAPEEIDLKNFEANRGHHGFTDEERTAFRDLLKTGGGYIDTFRTLYPEKIKYTWFSPFGNSRANNTGWRIDMFLISKKWKKNVEEADVLSDYKGSDHIPISLELKL
jgi:exodeoxyribonuclease III